ncbi:hypothetical protein NSE01_31570 [Novosphingobium sediminis]|uniref:DUF4402 domain-containing protein n=1 Tax=Novosphingobium sediminis TaxID=707214 RepID=A0A512ANN1_9SPHN|nr:DUF4402 domain-containing protein [Novosphingobium sediminis]GEO01325.1 hypothetical protein NSE01_31570 [Novosphingobium sediminis]
MKKIILASAIAFISATPAFAASGNTSSTNGSATATIVEPIVLTHTSGAALGFGRFTTGTGGTVTVTEAGVGSTGSDVAFVPGSTNSADAFGVTGDAGRSFSIATTSGVVSFSGNDMPFTTTASASSGALDTNGVASFTVGGTLTVAAGLPAGAYVGSYSATVTYN